MSRRSFLGRPVLFTLLVLAAVDASAQEARAWLDKMNRAVEELNYQGTFVHVLEGSAETLRIIHRREDGRSSERIESLDGVGREIIRHGNQVQCILPDRRVVLLEEPKDLSPLVSALPSYSDEIEPHYALNLHAIARVANRTAQILEIKPRDAFRYGYMLWLDQETAMPLRSQLIDDQGAIVEQILFTSIDLKAPIPPQAIDATIDALTRCNEFARAEAIRTVWCSGGYKKVLEWYLQDLLARRRHRYTSPFLLAEIYARLERPDEMFHWLEVALAERSPRLCELRTNAWFRRFRSMGRFRNVERRIGH